MLLAWFFWLTFPGRTIGRIGRGHALPRGCTEWLRPDRIENVGTVLAQWAVVLAVLWSANRWMGRSAAERTSVAAALVPRTNRNMIRTSDGARLCRTTYIRTKGRSSAPAASFSYRASCG